MSWIERFSSVLGGLALLAQLPPVGFGQDKLAMRTPETEVALIWGLKIPLEDKIVLNGTVYMPRHRKGPLPVICTITPYVSDQLHDDGMFFARNGYVFVTVDSRGRGNSGGEFRPCENDGTDGFQVIEWVARQPWCNGKLGMWGASYSAYIQWATLKAHPPHLRTIIPTSAPYPGIDFPARNNIFPSYSLRWLSLTSGRTANHRLFADADFWLGMYRELYNKNAPFASLDTLAGMPSCHFQNWLRHPLHDEYWRSQVPTREEYARMDVPILTITGQYDGDQLGAITYYREHMQYGPDDGCKNHYLIIGPWDHGAMHGLADRVGRVKCGKNSIQDVRGMCKRWYDRTLRDGPRALDMRVTYFVVEDDRWENVNSLLAIASQPEKYFLLSLQGQDKIAGRTGNLSAELPVTNAVAHYAYDPLDVREIVTPWALFEADPRFRLQEQRAADDLQGRGLIYDSEVLPTDVEVIGWPKLVAALSIDAPDTDFAVTISEIRSDGSIVFLCEDMIRARYRESLAIEKPVTPGAINLYTFDSFNFICRKIRKASRLRVALYCPNSIYWEKNYNSGGAVAHETRKDARTVHVTMHQDKEHQSYLVVPVVRSPGRWRISPDYYR
jgi:putative CocE/NonD family hydrolase